MSILAQKKNKKINDLKTAREKKKEKTARESEPNRVLINYNEPLDF